MVKVLALDLDGTVRETISGESFISQPNDQKLIDRAEPAIARFPDWKVVGITNQGGVKLGFKSFKDCVAEQQRTMELIPRMSLLVFCTNDGESCHHLCRTPTGRITSAVEQKATNYTGNFRKPNPGMLRFAWDYYNGVENFLYVGDRTEDRDAAKAADVAFIWAQDWRAIA